MKKLKRIIAFTILIYTPAKSRQREFNMEDLNNINKRTHKLILQNRRTCTISGVTDVLSFDISEIILETDQGMLMIKGSELHVNRLTLDKGEVDLDGRVDSFTYSETGAYQGKNESLLQKLFR